MGAAAWGHRVAAGAKDAWARSPGGPRVMPGGGVRGCRAGPQGPGPAATAGGRLVAGTEAHNPRAAASVLSCEIIREGSSAWGEQHEATRVHHAARRRGGMAARGARAAASAMRRIGVLMAHGAGRSGSPGPHRGVSARIAGSGLDRSAATCGSIRDGPQRCRAAASAGGGIGRARARTSCSPALATPLASLQQATRTMPIVFVRSHRSGRRRLRREPGAARWQCHRFRAFEYGLSGKWLELLKEIAPRVKRVGVLRDPGAGRRHRAMGGDPGCRPGPRRGAQARSTCAAPATSSATSRHSPASPTAA